MSILRRNGFKKDLIVPYGNMFLIGNGHIGYRGTMEEFGASEIVGFNIVGIYDKYLDKWRESLNLPNPIYLRTYSNDNEISLLNTKPLKHEIRLNLLKGLFSRFTSYLTHDIISERFIPLKEEDYLFYKAKIIAHKDLVIKVGLDLNIYEINGPHYKEKNIEINDNIILFTGLTNENKIIKEKVKYIFSKKASIVSGFYQINLKANEELDILIVSSINNENIDLDYEIEKKRHIKSFKNRMKFMMPEIDADNKTKFNLEYSMYQVNILGNPYHSTSIPARGVSGQVYKGAIFWDTEIFLMPLFTLVYPDIAESFIKYRINTLKGAIEKAKEFGYEGAFYAWESQDDGKEACSKYNITDAITNEPIRTYFNEKQIHISADIAYACFKYMEVSSNYSILDNGARLMLEEIAKFHLSYAKKIDGKYHFLDVIGPDEYHERVNDNAYTNYMIYLTLLKTIDVTNDLGLENKIKEFVKDIYLPKEINGIIEQFDGYFKLKESTIDEIRKKLRTPNEYWGFYAKETKIIKQADLITLMVLEPSLFDDRIERNCFDYYYKRTEHGSSLSSSMYSILASKLNLTDIAYKMFYKTASIDLSLDQKLYAGGIYIGGTHPAANAGAYLAVVFGMCGLGFKDNRIVINQHLPKEIRKVKFRIYYLGKKYQITVTNDNYSIEEVKS